MSVEEYGKKMCVFYCKDIAYSFALGKKIIPKTYNPVQEKGEWRLK